MDVETIWNKFLADIRNKVSIVSYELWFKNIKLVKLSNNKATILVESGNEDKDRFINNLKQTYYDTIKDMIDKLTDDSFELEFITEMPKPQIINKLHDEVKNDNDFDSFEEDDITKYKYLSNFNKKYTFDTFVVGDSNKVAYSTALSVAKNPGKLYNPLFIHGKSGLGKTHLMHAIGNYIVEHSDLMVLYISAEEFINDYKSIVRYSNNTGSNVTYLEAFRKKYRNIDVLMIDDIQFLNDAPKSQNEFTNTFNTLYDNEKQIIVASDTSIKDLDNLAERLKTRFLGGLIESVYPPDVQLKKEIIINKIKINDYNIDINNDIIDYIANYCGTDVRNIEGSVMRLVAYKAIFNLSEITLADAQKALVEFTENTTSYRKTSISKIIDIVSKYYNLDVSMIKGKMRKKEVVYARSIAMYLCRRKTVETVERIGLEFGGKNHSSVIYSTDKIEEERKTNLTLDNDLKILSEKICE